jgi:hypothetical protein
MPDGVVQLAGQPVALVGRRAQQEGLLGAAVYACRLRRTEDLDSGRRPRRIAGLRARHFTGDR